jgi:cholesterol transport system auxiliary component
MMPGTRVALSGAMGVLLAACVSLGQQEPQRFHVLDAAARDNPAKGVATPRDITLLVSPMSASSFYDTPEIVYSRAPSERAYYQLSAWTDRPSRRMTELLIERIQLSGSFATVAYAGSGVQGRLLLNTHLSSFYHDAAKPPGRAMVRVTAELIDPAQRRLTARRTFERAADVPTFDATGAVAALGVATGQLLDEIAAWVDTSAPR